MPSFQSDSKFISQFLGDTLSSFIINTLSCLALNTPRFVALAVPTFSSKLRISISPLYLFNTSLLTS